MTRTLVEITSMASDLAEEVECLPRAPAPNLGMKQQVCNPSTQRWRKQEDEKFQGILSYKLKKLKTILGYRRAFLKKPTLALNNKDILVRNNMTLPIIPAICPFQTCKRTESK